MYVLGVSLPNQESEQSCVSVRGIVTKPGECAVMYLCVRGIVTKPGE